MRNRQRYVLCRYIDCRLQYLIDYLPARRIYWHVYIPQRRRYSGLRLHLILTTVGVHNVFEILAMSTVSGWYLTTFQRKGVLPSSGRLRKWKNLLWWAREGLVSMPFLIPPDNGGRSILRNLDWNCEQCPEFCHHYSGLVGCSTSFISS